MFGFLHGAILEIPCFESRLRPNTHRNGMGKGLQMGAAKIVIDQTDPVTAFDALGNDPSSILIDVRTSTEWQQIGIPDLASLEKSIVLSEWVQLPDRSRNPEFLTEIRDALGETCPGHLFFICRSGARSLAAAQAVASMYGPGGGDVHCTNVAEGFEGDQPSFGPSSAANGWKARGLPWRFGD